jgi:hypothetical protein
MIDSPRRRRKRAPQARIRERPDGRAVLDLVWTDERGILQRSRTKHGSANAAAKAEAEAMRRLENGLAPFPEKESAPWTVADVRLLRHLR